MTTLELQGRITEDGNLEIRLPDGLPAGEVTVHIEVPDTPWTQAEIDEMMRPQRISFKQMVEDLEAHPPTEPWGDLKDDEDAAEYIHRIRHQSHVQLDKPGSAE